MKEKVDQLNSALAGLFAAMFAACTGFFTVLFEKIKKVYPKETVEKLKNDKKTGLICLIIAAVVIIALVLMIVLLATKSKSDETE